MSIQYLERTRENELEEDDIGDKDHFTGKKRKTAGCNSTQTSKRVRSELFLGSGHNKVTQVSPIRHPNKVT